MHCSQLNVQLLLPADVSDFALHTSCVPCTCRGIGGRQAAKDPRLDPAIDAKKARQILNNRKNAAVGQLMKKIAGLVRRDGVEHACQKAVHELAASVTMLLQLA
jgi:hypothetical protein